MERLGKLQQTDMTNQPIPPGWVTTNLGSLLTVLRGVSYKKPDARYSADTGLVPILRATNIDRTLNFESLVYVPSRYIKEEQFLKPGDIVIAASSGSQSVVGKAAQLTREWPGSFGAFCLGLRPDARLSNQYLAWFMQSQGYRNRVSTLAAGVNINNLKREHLEEIPLPLPPLPEQRRIVAEIETQFTRLDASVSALRRAQANLKRYRASVLKSACEGSLVPTEAELARSEGRDYEPSDALLERIQTERRARWESQEKRRGKYKEPSAPDTSDLPVLSEGWAWTTLAQISEIQGGIQKQPKRAPARNAFPFLRVANVLRGNLDLEEVHQIELFPGELDKLRLVSGDLLIVEGNGSPSQIGRMATWKGEIENCVHQNHIIRARVYSGIEAGFVESYWNSPTGSSLVLDVASSTSGLYTLSVSKVSDILLPLPPLAEQFRIVAEVERRLSVIQQAEATVMASLARADRLRQSILKQAFSGQLVPQDPDDEPASALLERIRDDREAARVQATKPPPRTRRRAKPKSPR